MNQPPNQFLAHDSEQKHVHSDASHNNLDTINVQLDEHDHDHEHGHSHDHAETLRQASGRVLFWCLIATFAFSLVEGVGGYLIHSIALQSDAVHMMTDAAGLMIAYFANVIAKRPANENLTFGYGKAEVLGALINCMFTTVLTLWLLSEVIRRFLTPVTVHGGSLFVIASIGFVVNALIVWMLSKNADSLNTKAAMLHAIGDLLASLVAIIAGAIIYFTGWSIVDPILSLIVIILLIVSNFKLIKKSMRILMAGVPEHLDYNQVGKDLLAIDGILDVHDLHIWYISANQIALAAHVVACNPYGWPSVLQEAQVMLLKQHGISHVTLQHEFDKQRCQEIGCCPE